MSEVQCFWIEPTGFGQRVIRRFAYKVPGDDHYHDASAVIEEHIVVQRDAQGFLKDVIETTDGVKGDDERKGYPAANDPRWPTKCAACDYVFKPNDQWQMTRFEEWVRPDTGEIVGYNLMHMPEGAMWDAKWDHRVANRYPDGIILTVQLPDGTAWNVDGPTSPAGGDWKRTGDPKAMPPTVSATPSIHVPGRYHGFLTDGVLRSV